jgi:hypothetical protein
VGRLLVEPGRTYTYRVVPVSGTPAALVHARRVEVTVTTERVDLGTHAIFFNRGAVGSQEYARRFQNLTPPQVGRRRTTGSRAGWSRGSSRSSARPAPATPARRVLRVQEQAHLHRAARSTRPRRRRSRSSTTATASAPRTRRRWPARASTAWSSRARTRAASRTTSSSS